VRQHRDELVLAAIGLAQRLSTPVSNRQSFSRADRQTANQVHTQGLGIGLALVKSIAEGHGGTVEARSDGLERGSEFVIRLPLKCSALPVP
jgi:signal transduction histidine kinase